MIAKPNNFDEIEVRDYDYEPLEVGGHKCIIKKAEEYTSEISGKTSLKIEIDTDSADKQPHYYQKRFDEDTRQDKKWSNSATKYVPLGQEENQVRMLKGFITAVENSNNGYRYDWNREVNQLVGKKIGASFGLEEYLDNEGAKKTNVKIRDFRSYDKVDNIKAPKIKTLSGDYMSMEDYNDLNNQTSNNAYEQFGDIVEVVDNILD